MMFLKTHFIQSVSKKEGLEGFNITLLWETVKPGTHVPKILSLAIISIQLYELKITFFIKKTFNYIIMFNYY